jgi:site-specific DNA-methyltransferase (adenine-specific)
MHKVEFENVTLWHGDCLEVLPILSGVDAVISDPPYGMKYKSGANSSNSISSTGKRYTETVEGDDKPFDPSPWLDYVVAFTGAHWFYDRLPAGGTIHTWDKCGGYKPLDQADADQIWSSVQEPPRIFRLVWRGICRHAENTEPILHPTQKPVSLMAWMMERARVLKGATVLDPYMGSGTTGIACIRTGRKFIGIEKTSVHFTTACKRIEQELSQGQLAL